MPEDPCARAAYPCRGQFPRSAAGGTAAGAAAVSDRAWPETTLNPRIHCRGTHRQAAIADVRHVRNGTGRCCTLRGYGQGQPHLPAASGNRDVKPGLNRDYGIHVGRTGCVTQPCDPAIFRGTCRRSMSCTPGNQTPAEPVRSGSRARPLLNRPSRRSSAISQTGRGRNTRTDSIAADRTTSSRMPVQYGGAEPTPLRRPRVGT